MISNEVRIDNFGSSNTYLDFPIYITKSDLGKGVIDSVLESIAENSIFYIPRGCTFRIDEFDMLEIKDSDSFVIAKLPMIDEDLYLYPRISMGRGVISQPQYDEDIAGLKPNSLPVDGEEGEVPEPVEDLHDVTFQVTYQNQPVTDAIITLGSITNAAGEYTFIDMPSGITNYTISTSIADDVSGQIVVGMITKPVELEIANPVLTLPVETINFENRSYQSQTFMVEGNVIWTATAQPDSFIKITQGSGQGNGIVVFNILKNETVNQRTTSITVTGGGLSVDYVITQAAGEAFIRLSPVSMSYDPLAQLNKVVNVISNINWTASIVEGDGITILGDNTGEGNGLITYSLPSNASAMLKSYKIRFSGNGVATDFDIQQGAKETILTVNNTNLIYSASEHINQEINITSNSVWTALITEGDFFRLNTNAGTGNGVLKISLDLNDKTTDRTGVIKVSGGGITVLINIKQLKGGENIKVTPEFRNYTKDASFNQSITIESNTTWMAIADLGITIKSGGSGIGNGTLFFDISAGARDPRTLKITIKGIESEVTFSAIQEADPLAQGDGSVERPFIVYDCATLQKVGSGVDGWTISSCYKQVNDIDWSDSGTMRFTPLPGARLYDGGGYKISNLIIYESTHAAMFVGRLAKVINLTIDNANIEGIHSAAAIWAFKPDLSLGDYYHYLCQLYSPDYDFSKLKASINKEYGQVVFKNVKVLNSNIKSNYNAAGIAISNYFQFFYQWEITRSIKIEECLLHKSYINSTTGVSSGFLIYDNSIHDNPMVVDILLSQSNHNIIEGFETSGIYHSGSSHLNNYFVTNLNYSQVRVNVSNIFESNIIRARRFAHALVDDLSYNLIQAYISNSVCASNFVFSDGYAVMGRATNVSNSYIYEKGIPCLDRYNINIDVFESKSMNFLLDWTGNGETHRWYAILIDTPYSGPSLTRISMSHIIPFANNIIWSSAPFLGGLKLFQNYSYSLMTIEEEHPIDWDSLEPQIPYTGGIGNFKWQTNNSAAASLSLSSTINANDLIAFTTDGNINPTINNDFGLRMLVNVRLTIDDVTGLLSNPYMAKITLTHKTSKLPIVSTTFVHNEVELPFPTPYMVSGRNLYYTLSNNFMLTRVINVQCEYEWTITINGHMFSGHGPGQTTVWYVDTQSTTPPVIIFTAYNMGANREYTHQIYNKNVTNETYSGSL